MKVSLEGAHRERFVELIHLGAAAQDIHAPGIEGPDPGHRASDAFVSRELGRVAMHLKSLVPLLEKHCGQARRILDVGCSTAGATAAIALSPSFEQARVTGVDPNVLAVEAGHVRIQGLDLSGRVALQAIDAGERLPFDDASFDLVVSVSVLEFVPAGQRALYLAELQRVTCSGGHIYLSSPSVLALRELHTGRWFGNQRRTDAAPWASRASQIRRLLPGCRAVAIVPPYADRLAARLRLSSGSRVMAPVLGAAKLVAPWKKLLFRKH